MVIGKKPYIPWARLQAKGLGRSMKIGKENILGFTQAVEDYLKNGSEPGESMKKRLVPFIDELNKIDHLEAKMVQDPAGREIYRASVKIMDQPAIEVITALKEKNPAIYTRDYQANHGIIEFDIRAVNDEEMKKIIVRLKEIMA